MITINLLPSEKKGQLMRKKIYKLLLYQEIVFASVFVFFAAILFSNNMVLELRAALIDESAKIESSRSGSRELQKYDEKFSETNEKVSNLANIEQNHLLWSRLLEKMNNKDFEGIVTKELTTKNFEITMRGEADTRERLISFKNELEQDECFSEIEVPLSNLVTKTDVDFVINFKIDSSCLRYNQ